MAMQYVRYEDFGAKGDGHTDDMPAIVAAHAHANEAHLPVKTDPDATYYIGGGEMTATIATDVDWTTSRFIIDDRALANRNASLFVVPSLLERIPLSLTELRKGQRQLEVTLPSDCLVFVRNEHKKMFIRKGVNASSGTVMRDFFVARQSGEVLSFISWDFAEITGSYAKPIETEALRIQGGQFTTLANQEESKYNYHARNIHIRRSRVELSGLTHTVEGEGETGAPYAGFLSVSEAAYVTLRDCHLSGHKLYHTLTTRNEISPMGTYDINLNTTAFVNLVNITQQPSIMDSRYWGLMGTNFCKDLSLQGCVISCCDAHTGAANVTVRDCSIGWQQLAVIGHGELLVENSTVYGSALVSLRYDYGSHWDGKLTIKNCVWQPRGKHPAVIAGANEGNHDFGYDCQMPTNIDIDDLLIDDTKATEMEEIYLLNRYDGDYAPGKPFPYRTPRHVRYQNVRTKSGREVLLYPQAELYADTVIEAL